MVAGVAPGVTGLRLVSNIPHSMSNRSNLSMFILYNIRTTRHPMTSKATPAATEDGLRKKENDMSALAAV